jgi:hypothetical protein
MRQRPRGFKICQWTSSKHGGELMASDQLEYPCLRDMVVAIA